MSTFAGIDRSLIECPRLLEHKKIYTNNDFRHLLYQLCAGNKYLHKGFLYHQLNPIYFILIMISKIFKTYIYKAEFLKHFCISHKFYNHFGLFKIYEEARNFY